MKDFCRGLSALAVALACCGSWSRAQAGELSPLRLVVLHTNDVHGQVLPQKRWAGGKELPEAGGLGRLAARVGLERALAERSGEQVLVLDAGDWSQGTPEGLVDEGAAFVSGMVLVGYDAMALGNHEFDLGLASLRRVLDRSGAPAVCANLQQRPDGPPVEWVEPWRIVRRGSLRVGLVGLLTPLTPAISSQETRALGFEDPVLALARARTALKRRVDVLIALTHLGVSEDERLATQMQSSRADGEAGLALVVGGHTHTFLPAGLSAGGTLIVQAGTKAAVLGRAELELDPRTYAVLGSRAELLELREEPALAARSKAVELAAHSMLAKSDASMAERLGTLESPLKRGSGLVSGSAGNFIADQMRSLTGAQIGLMNRGGIRRDLAAGPVIRRDLFELVPFPNTVVLLELRGAELLRWIGESIEGSAHSGLEVSGLELVARDLGAGQREFVRAELDGVALLPERFYSVATNSFLAQGGDGYSRDEAAKEPLDTGVLVREMLERAFQGQRTLTPSNQNRYRVLAPKE